MEDKLLNHEELIRRIKLLESYGFERRIKIIDKYKTIHYCDLLMKHPLTGDTLYDFSATDPDMYAHQAIRIAFDAGKMAGHNELVINVNKLLTCKGDL